MRLLGSGEPLRGQFEGVELIGERQPDEPVVMIVQARRAAFGNRHPIPARDVGEGVRGLERQLDPERESGRWRRGASGGQVPGKQADEVIAPLGESGLVRGQPTGPGTGKQLGGEYLVDGGRS